jgi:hypothetical protein
MDTITDNNSFIQDFKDDMKFKRDPYIDWASIITEKNDKFKNHTLSANLNYNNIDNNASNIISLKNLNLQYLTDNELYSKINNFTNEIDKYYIAINIINKSNFTNINNANITSKQALSNIIEENYLLDSSIHFLDQQMEFFTVDDHDKDYVVINGIGLDNNIYINGLLEKIYNIDNDNLEEIDYLKLNEDGIEIDIEKANIEFKINLLSNKTLSIDEQMKDFEELFDFIENKSIRDKYDLLFKKIINNLNTVLKINTIYSLIIIKKEEILTIMKNEDLINVPNINASNINASGINASNIGYFKPSKNYFTEFNGSGGFSNTMITLDDIINNYKISQGSYGEIEDMIITKMQGNTLQGFLNDFMKSFRMEGFENKGTTILNIFICLILIFLIYQMNK